MTAPLLSRTSMTLYEAVIAIIFLLGCATSLVGVFYFEREQRKEADGLEVQARKDADGAMLARIERLEQEIKIRTTPDITNLIDATKELRTTLQTQQSVLGEVRTELLLIRQQLEYKDPDRRSFGPRASSASAGATGAAK